MQETLMKPSQPDTAKGLYETDADANPFRQFQRWLDHALASVPAPDPTAMTLATVNADGKPAARVVLLKSFDENGLVFFTNYESRKGQELAARPFAALIFWWGALERQIRIEGRVEKVAPEMSDHYFHSRPRGSQLGALASDQSQVIINREVLEQRLEILTRQYAESEVPRPPQWGGYRVIPDLFEFWQGRADRLHDRLRYRRQGDSSWQIERLAP